MRDINAQAAAIFAKAAQYIRTYGWQETGMSSHGKPRCSMGALESAYPKKKWNDRLAKLMYDALYKELKGISLTEFNRATSSGLEVASLFENTAQSIRRMQ